MQYGFVFDPAKCTGCQACQVACDIENKLDPYTPWREVYTFNPRRIPGLPLFHLSLACHHCQDPACMRHCPALAYTKSPQTGAVLIDPEKCIGCKYCTWACPYDAPRFNAELGIMQKCTFCQPRLEAGASPACVTSCPTSALQVEEVEQPSHGATVPGFQYRDINPSIRFVEDSRGGSLAAERAGIDEISPSVWIQLKTRLSPPPKISLRSEWSLLLFTLLIGLLVGYWGGATLAGTVVSPGIFLSGAAMALLFSTLHLGRKERAWRAILNWRRSWLSREILLVSGFLGLAVVTMWLQPASVTWRWLALIIGLPALFAIDKVYHVTDTPYLDRHSARVLFSGLLWLSLFAGSLPALLLMASLKLTLYTWRQLQKIRLREPVVLANILLRIGIGFTLPVVLVSLTGQADHLLVLLSLGVGELIDRMEFYQELEVSTPAKQMLMDLEKSVMKQELQAEA